MIVFDALRATFDTFRRNSTELEIVALVGSVFAVWFSGGVLRTALRHYRYRDELPAERGSDPDEDADFLILDVRTEVLIFAVSCYLFYGSLIACFLQPPSNLGPYNLFSASVRVGALALIGLIVATKMVNRRVRDRIYARIRHRLSDMTIAQAEVLTRDARHALKNRIAKLEAQREMDRRDKWALIRALEAAGIKSPPLIRYPLPGPEVD